MITSDNYFRISEKRFVSRKHWTKHEVLTAISLQSMKALYGQNMEYAKINVMLHTWMLCSISRSRKPSSYEEALRTLKVISYSSTLRTKNSEESNWVAVAFRCCCALVIIVLNSMKNLSVSGGQVVAPADAILYSKKALALRGAWVRNDITSCFAKSFPLPHLL